MKDIVNRTIGREIELAAYHRSILVAPVTIVTDSPISTVHTNLYYPCSLLPTVILQGKVTFFYY